MNFGAPLTPTRDDRRSIEVVHCRSLVILRRWITWQGYVALPDTSSFSGLNLIMRLLASLCFLVYSMPVFAGEARLLRFPTIHGNQVVFTHAGNLYTVAAKGGIARRLTSHHGFEMFPRFSPDGQRIAFTGEYDGNTEVYTIPATGGTPKRLTYTATLSRDDVSDRMGPNNIVMGWTHDGNKILFRSRMRSFNPFLGSLYTVAPDGGLPEEVPLPRGGFASFSPDDSKLVYNRVFREFRTWKRYRGGMADDLWVYDAKANTVERLLENRGQDIIPMWHEQQIYFLSDRGDAKRMNLYVHHLKSNKTRQLTHFRDFDIKFPSLGDQAIVFELGGYLYRFDLAKEETNKIPVEIYDDMPTARNSFEDVSDEISNYEISPDGNKALFGARGEVFTVPAKTPGMTHNLTQSSGVHERDSKWSPDGQYIAYVGDATGETELYIVRADGSEPAKRLTTAGDTYKYDVRWSPDSKKLLWSDRRQRLRIVEIDSKKVTEITRAKAFEIRDYAWSPDSQWVVFSQPEEKTLSRIYLYSLEQNKLSPVTAGFYDASNPTFSHDGKYLFFVSNRTFNPIYSQTEWNHAYQDMAKIYLVTLTKATPNPLKPAMEELDTPPAAAPENGMKVDIDGLSNRSLELPVQAASYRALSSAGNRLFYLRNGSKDTGTRLLSFDFQKRKETNHGAISGYEISANGKKILVAQNGKYAILDLPSGVIKLSEPLKLDNLEVQLDRSAEWKQIFDETWRQMRDFFYDPNLHGVDWRAVRRKYAPLVKHVRHRKDLTYVIGEMIGELNAGHAYVGGGDVPKVKRIPTGLLGAKLEKHQPTGYYRIKEILPGESWDENLRSPLNEIGVDIDQGDYIIAIDGKPTNEVSDLYSLLLNKADKPVLLKVNKEPAEKNARTVMVRPIRDEANLYYHQWVQNNMAKVHKMTDGQVGYIHVPDMLANGLNQFMKYYYPQLGKKGLIIDVRGNGGGNVSPMLIERLRREIAMVDIARNTLPSVDPSGTFTGPMVCLMNEFSASDGDLFPYRFKHYKLGPVIGKRSWGGVIGIRGSLPLLDGGSLNKPEFSRYDIAGKKWIIEGYGVDPDIEVDNDPVKEYAGEDQQLKKAVEVLVEKLKKPFKLPPVPPYPRR